MLKLIYTIGLSGSGKSTWANDYAKQHNMVIVERDLFRDRVLNEQMVEWTKENEAKYVVPYWRKQIEGNLAKGQSVIVSDTNLSHKARRILNEIANKYKAKLIEQSFLDVSLETCIERDSKRDSNKQIGEKAIRKQYSAYVLPILREKSNLDLIKISNDYKNLTMTENKYIICDIDGTVAIMHNRGPFEWEKVGEDLPIHQTIDLLKSFMKAMNYKVIFMSGRSEVCRTQTEEWIKTHLGINYEALFMRKEKDNRKDSIIKEELYLEHVKNKYNVAFVVDDRPQVVRTWRKLGLFVFDVNQSGFEF